MITIIALMIQVLVSLITPADSASAVVVIPAKPQHAPTTVEAADWAMYWHEAYEEYEAEFTALFNSYSYKLSKNGRSMINGKFVKMGV
jgi:hypothetical protein